MTEDSQIILGDYMDDSDTNQNGRKKKVRVEGMQMVEKENWL